MAADIGSRGSAPSLLQHLLQVEDFSKGEDRPTDCRYGRDRLQIIAREAGTNARRGGRRSQYQPSAVSIVERKVRR